MDTGGGGCGCREMVLTRRVAWLVGGGDTYSDTFNPSQRRGEQRRRGGEDRRAGRRASLAMVRFRAVKGQARGRAAAAVRVVGERDGGAGEREWREREEGGQDVPG